jgi:hypothetical protein
MTKLYYSHTYNTRSCNTHTELTTEEITTRLSTSALQLHTYCIQQANTQPPPSKPCCFLPSMNHSIFVPLPVKRIVRTCPEAKQRHNPNNPRNWLDLVKYIQEITPWSYEKREHQSFRSPHLWSDCRAVEITGLCYDRKLQAWFASWRCQSGSAQWVEQFIKYREIPEHG